MTTYNYNDNYSDVMSYDDSINEIDEIRMIEEAKRKDIGYNKFFRTFKYTNDKGHVKTKRIRCEFYTTTNNIGSLIRDAESGEYYKSHVGSADEDLYFKAIIHSGLCKNKSNSTTAFFSSPNAYMNFMECELSDSIINAWELKRNARLEALSKIENKTINMSTVVVR